MASLRSLLFLLSTSAVHVHAERLRVVWSAGGFSTISGPGTSNSHGHDSGFTILKENNEPIYEADYPGDYAPCMNTNNGRLLTLGGDCWNSERTFRCLATGGGNTKNCEVYDADDNSLGTGEGQTDTTFIGIAIGQDSSCVVEFDSDGDCSGSGDLHVTNVDVAPKV